METVKNFIGEHAPLISLVGTILFGISVAILSYNKGRNDMARDILDNARRVH